jgi:tetratricopeptide (TPR) repeat protein
MMPQDQGGQEQPPPSQIKQKAGDRAIQIGQVFGGVILQVIPPKTALIILAAFAVAAGGVYWAYRASQRPSPMRGDFNIAVAQFGEVTDQGIRATARATVIGDWLASFLDSEYRLNAYGQDVEVAHDKIGIVTEEREAAQLAKDINAHIVIYGTVYYEGDKATFAPSFYVAGQTDAEELTGQHELAEQIRFEKGELEDLHKQLSSRAGVLVFFTKGLVCLTTDDTDGALYYFQQAIQQSKDQEVGSFKGQEVLYLFEGVAYQRQGNFEEAFKSLDQALDLNHAYARAYIARGNAYYAQAQQPNWDKTKLEQALAEYQQAIEKDPTPDVYIRTKVNLALGNVYVVQAQQSNDDPKLFDQAISYYKQVIERHDRSDQETKERLRGMAATANYGLGVAYERQEDFAQARGACQQCINLASNPGLDSGLTKLKSRCEEYLSHIEEHLSHIEDSG